MAVEMGLNHYTHHPPRNESELEWRQRRNKERTFLVLFVHDRRCAGPSYSIWLLIADI